MRGAFIGIDLACSSFLCIVGSLVLGCVSLHRPASNVTLLLLKDVLVQCMVCHRDVKAGCYEGHECTPSLTAGEEREAAALLKRAISISPDKGIILEGAVKCIQYHLSSYVILDHT